MNATRTNRGMMVEMITRVLDNNGFEYSLNTRWNGFWILSVTDKNGVHPLRFRDNEFLLSNDYYKSESSTTIRYDAITLLHVASSRMSHNTVGIHISTGTTTVHVGFMKYLQG